MRIGSVEVKRGERVFGALNAGQTHGGFALEVPFHVVRGSSEGPVLLVQSGVSGLEIEPAMILPKVLEEIDPAEISGTLIVVPLLNTSGFEFEQVNAVWDDKDLNSLGRGKPNGTVSEQMVHAYFEDVISRADAIIDVHTGALWGYFRYAGVYRSGAVEESEELAVALGLPQVLVGQPEDSSMAFEAAQAGKVVVSAWIGGGPGLRDYGQDDLGRVGRAVFNALRHLGMLTGEPEFECDSVAIIEQHTVLRVSGERGLTFMDQDKRGSLIQAGERIGYVRHPFTGEVIEEIRAMRQGVLVHGGASWPVVPEGGILGILGDVTDEVRAR